MAEGQLRPVPADPLESPVWDAMVANYLKDHPIVFDNRVVVGLPPVTEDQTHVPIMVDARQLGKVDEMVILGDLSPFPLTLKVRPHMSAAKFLDAAGGGCEAPPATEAKLDWSTIGQMRGKVPHAKLVPGHGPVEPGRRGIDQTHRWLEFVDGAMNQHFNEGLDEIEIMATDMPAWTNDIAVARYEYQRSAMHLMPRLELARLPIVS